MSNRPLDLLVLHNGPASLHVTWLSNHMPNRSRISSLFFPSLEPVRMYSIRDHELVLSFETRGRVLSNVTASPRVWKAIVKPFLEGITLGTHTRLSYIPLSFDRTSCKLGGPHQFQFHVKPQNLDLPGQRLSCPVSIDYIF